MEHFDVALFPVSSVLDAQAVFEITIDPHFTDHVAIQRQI
jgi:hypothetical protein